MAHHAHLVVERQLPLEIVIYILDRRRRLPHHGLRLVPRQVLRPRNLLQRLLRQQLRQRSGSARNYCHPAPLCKSSACNAWHVTEQQMLRRHPADLQRVCVVYAGSLWSAVRAAGCHRCFLQQRGVKRMKLTSRSTASYAVRKRSAVPENPKSAH